MYVMSMVVIDKHVLAVINMHEESKMPDRALARTWL